MKSKTLPSSQRKGRKGGKFFPALCNTLGTLILILVVLVCLPLTLPRFLGYEIYHVVSGSMEPSIPVGSVVYVQPVDPMEVESGEVIAYWEEAMPVTHRVVGNNAFERKFITKGDANEANDINPVPYEALIGRVKYHFPVIGQFMTLLASKLGKAYLLCFAACGVMFNILASRLREHNREKARRLAAEAEALRLDPGQSSGAHVKKPAPRGPSKKKKTVRRVLMLIFLCAFLFAGGTVLFVKHRYKVSDQHYSDAIAQFTTVSDAAAPAELPAPEPGQEDSPAVKRLAEYAPIKVDFEALKEINPEVVAWIYCPETKINYPVMQGKDNDYYLHHNYSGRDDLSGAIFVEAQNSPDFRDYNTILYGHHMNDWSMFATLDYWQGQSFFDAHPVMWLLTPEQDYKIQLFSSHVADQDSNTYMIFPEANLDFSRYLKLAAADSAVQADVELDPDSHYVLLSTCAYVFQNARSVVHGKLLPLSSAGGYPIREMN